METIIHYFNQIPALDRALILAGGIAFFWMIESAAPLFHFRYPKWKHASVNLFFTFTTILVNFAFALLIVFTSYWCARHQFGLLYLANMPAWLVLIIGLMLLDFFGAYLIHFIEHKVKWMWRFHVIHHLDTHVDTTTANRHHPVESIFRAIFTLLAVIISGAPVWLVMLYQSASVVLSQFNHANIHLPAWLDKTISWIIVSPNMHKIHHHYKRPQTDTNYGNIFSIWDRLFQTYDFTPTNQLKYGLDMLTGKNENNIKEQIIIPFSKLDLSPPAPKGELVKR